MRRREFIAGLGVAAVWPLAGRAQQGERVRRIGVLMNLHADDPESMARLTAFLQTLQELGWTDGRNVRIDTRWAAGDPDRFRTSATELVALMPDVILATGISAVAPLQLATRSVPIVFTNVVDPVGAGLVASLARPGGNVTGLSLALAEGFSGKWVELLKEADATVSHVAYLYHDPGNPAITRDVKDIHVATQALGLTFQPLEVRQLDELDSLFAALSQKAGSALIVGGEPLFFPHRSRLPELAAKYRLPTIYGFRVFVDAGGLMSYGVSLPDLWRRVAVYMDKILKGAKPADLPVEQPTKFELVINLKTAKDLGITIPPALLFQADEVIR
jgi:putative ABC transport system substrate-binding protein